MQSGRPAPSPRHAPAAAPHLQERGHVFNLTPSACCLVSLLGISKCGLPGQHLASCRKAYACHTNHPNSHDRHLSDSLGHIRVPSATAATQMSLLKGARASTACHSSIAQNEGLAALLPRLPFCPAFGRRNAYPQPQLSSSLSHTYLAYKPQVLARGPQTMRDDRDREPPRLLTLAGHTRLGLASPPAL